MVSQAAAGAPDPGVAAFLEAHPYFQSNPSLAAQAIMDPTKIDPVAQAYIRNNLIPTSASGLLTPNGKAYDDEYTLKFDDNATAKDHITLTLDKFHNPQEYPFLPGLAPNVPGFPGLSTFGDYFGSVAYTRLFSASTINEFHLTAQRNDNHLNYPGTTLPGPSQLGAAITPDQTTGPPQLLFNGGPQIGFNLNGPAHFTDTTYMFGDTFTKTLSRAP